MNKQQHIKSIANAIVLPAIILFAVFFNGQGMIPSVIGDQITPTQLPYLQVLALLAIGLLFTNTIRWPFQVLIFFGFGLIASSLHQLLFKTPVNNSFCFSMWAWYGVAIVTGWKGTVRLRFVPKIKLPSILLLLLFIGLEMPVNYVLFDKTDVSKVLDWKPTGIALAAGLASYLVLAFIIQILAQIRPSVKKIFFQPCYTEPEIITQTRPSIKQQIKTKKAAPAPRTLKQRKVAPAVAQSPIEQPTHPISSTPSDETGKILSRTDLREVRTTKGRRKSQPQQDVPPPAQESQSQPDDDDQDWLSKHLNALD